MEKSAVMHRATVLLFHGARTKKKKKEQKAKEAECRCGYASTEKQQGADKDLPGSRPDSTSLF